MRGMPSRGALPFLNWPSRPSSLRFLRTKTSSRMKPATSGVTLPYDTRCPVPVTTSMIGSALQ